MLPVSLVLAVGLVLIGLALVAVVGMAFWLLLAVDRAARPLDADPQIQRGPIRAA